jgi:hypothetical protein
MKFESSKPKPTPVEQAKATALESLRSESQVHAGFRALSPQERSSLEGILSAAGTSGPLDEILDSVSGETLRDLQDYAESAPNSEERRALAAGIKEAIAKAREAD